MLGKLLMFAAAPPALHAQPLNAASMRCFHPNPARPHPHLSPPLHPAGTPTVQLFKNKDMLTLVPGVKQKREYRELLSSNL